MNCSDVRRAGLCGNLRAGAARRGFESLPPRVQLGNFQNFRLRSDHMAWKEAPLAIPTPNFNGELCVGGRFAKSRKILRIRLQPACLWSVVCRRQPLAASCVNGPPRGIPHFGDRLAAATRRMVMRMTNGQDDRSKGGGNAMADGRGKSLVLRFVGDRFADADLPVDMLSDLKVLGDLVVALAKREFLRRHPERREVPPGFDEAVSLVLGEVGKGSAMPKLNYRGDAARRMFPDFADELEEVVYSSFDRVAFIYDAASHDDIPEFLSTKEIKAMSGIGANMRKGEYMEFQDKKGRDGKVVRWSRERRDNFVELYQRERSRARERGARTIKFKGTGPLVGIDTMRNSIQIQTSEHGCIWLPLDGLSQKISRFDGNLSASINFSANIALKANGKFKSVEKVHSAEIDRTCSDGVLECIERLSELSKLEKGWLGEGDGESISPLAVSRAMHLIYTRSHLADLYLIYPTEEGGISIEFREMPWRYAAEMMPDGAIEIDSSSRDGEYFELRSFSDLSNDFFMAFDEMTARIGNEQNS